MNTVLDVQNLTKKFGKRTVVDSLTLETRPGEVFGFLGPNGAGKTTTIKMLTGLLFSDSGTISVGGQDIRKHYEKAIGQMGAIVENPELYGHLTGTQNLKYFARMRRGVTPQRIEEVTRLVGLSGRVDDKVKKYSLGMKQRLGIAVSILHHPSLLILDEPTNGLDPEGIRLLRDVVKKLAHEEGLCVLVSSHLMGEMEMMCDRVGIIIEGRMERVQTIQELLHSMDNPAAQGYRFSLNDPWTAAVVAEKLSLTVSEVTDSGLLLTCEAERLPQINKAFIEAGLLLSTVEPLQHNSLEDAFIELTQKEGGQIA